MSVGTGRGSASAAAASAAPSAPPPPPPPSADAAASIARSSAVFTGSVHSTPSGSPLLRHTRAEPSSDVVTTASGSGMRQREETASVCARHAAAGAMSGRMRERAQASGGGR